MAVHLLKPLRNAASGVTPVYSGDEGVNLSATGAVRMTTAGGSATHNVSYSSR